MHASVLNIHVHWRNCPQERKQVVHLKVPGSILDVVAVQPNQQVMRI